MNLSIRISASYYIDHLADHPSTIQAYTRWMETAEISDQVSLNITRYQMGNPHEIGQPKYQ